MKEGRNEWMDNLANEMKEGRDLPFHLLDLVCGVSMVSLLAGPTTNTLAIINRLHLIVILDILQILAITIRQLIISCYISDTLLVLITVLLICTQTKLWVLRLHHHFQPMLASCAAATGCKGLEINNH